MLRYFLARLVTFLPTFIGVTLISFAFIRVLPGDPIIVMAGERGMTQERYDALVQETILNWAPQAEHIYAGKRGGKPSAKQRDISLRLVDLARAGKRVLRLKGGDPFVFGRGGEEAQTLVQAGVPIRITPGITAGIGGLAYEAIKLSGKFAKSWFIKPAIFPGLMLQKITTSQPDDEQLEVSMAALRAVLTPEAEGFKTRVYYDLPDGESDEPEVLPVPVRLALVDACRSGSMPSISAITTVGIGLATRSIRSNSGQPMISSSPRPSRR